jgi:hypothetical protein
MCKVEGVGAGHFPWISDIRSVEPSGSIISVCLIVNLNDVNGIYQCNSSFCFVYPYMSQMAKHMSESMAEHQLTLWYTRQMP